MQDFSNEFPLLVANSGHLDGQRFKLSKTLIIGREPTSCNIVIPSRQVSRHHARLIPTAEGVMLEDMGSKNGTYYNTALLSTPFVLKDGDIVSVAPTQEFIFLNSDATMPLTAQNHHINKLVIDTRSRRIWVNNKLLVPLLSVQQFQLLHILYNKQGQVVSRPELVEAVWENDELSGVSNQALDALVRRLRDRLAATDPNHNYIVTVRGHGLRLDNPPE